MSRTVSEILDDALLHFGFVEHYAEQNLDDSMVIDAIAMRLSAAIDALNRLPQEVKDELFGDMWKLMYGMRNRIAHGYAVFDAEMMRQTVEVELPPLVEKIRSFRTTG